MRNRFTLFKLPIISLCLSFCRFIRQSVSLGDRIICIQTCFLLSLLATAVYASVVSACRTRLFVSGRLLRRDCACPVSHEQTSKSSSQTFKLDRTIQWEKSSASNHCPFCPALGIVFERSFSPMQYRLAFKVQIHPVTLSSLTTSSAPPVFNLGGTVKKAPPAMAERRRSGVKKLKPGEQGSSDTEGTMSLYDRTPVVQTLGQRRVATRSPSWITRCAICHCHVWDAQTDLVGISCQNCIETLRSKAERGAAHLRGSDHHGLLIYFET